MHNLKQIHELVHDLYQAREDDLEGGAAWLSEANHVEFVKAYPRLCAAIEKLAQHVNSLMED